MDLKELRSAETDVSEEIGNEVGRAMQAFSGPIIGAIKGDMMELAQNGKAGCRTAAINDTDFAEINMVILGFDHTMSR